MSYGLCTCGRTVAFDSLRFSQACTDVHLVNECPTARVTLAVLFDLGAIVVDASKADDVYNIMHAVRKMR